MYKRFEEFVLNLLFFLAFLLSPLLTYTHFQKVSSYTQAIYCILVLLIAIGSTIWITKKWERGISSKKQKAELDFIKVEVIQVKTTRAIKREDIEDFGIAYYLDVEDQGTRKTLFLWGQFLDEIEEDRIFPNTHFEITRTLGSNEFIDFRLFGHYFKEEKTLPPFEKEIWHKSTYPTNGQLLNQSIDTIV